nr:hypothetical protein [Chlamydiota bacterium]
MSTPLNFSSVSLNRFLVGETAIPAETEVTDSDVIGIFVDLTANFASFDPFSGNGQSVSLLGETAPSFSVWDEVGPESPAGIAGETTLHMASCCGNLVNMKHLLEFCENLNEWDIDGRTCLHCAVENNQTDAMQLLLASGARVAEKDKDSWTPLHSASMSGNHE